MSSNPLNINPLGTLSYPGVEDIANWWCQIINELTGKIIIIDLPGKVFIDLAGFSIFIDLAGKNNNEMKGENDLKRNY